MALGPVVAAVAQPCVYRDVADRWPPHGCFDDDMRRDRRAFCRAGVIIPRAPSFAIGLFAFNLMAYIALSFNLDLTAMLGSMQFAGELDPVQSPEYLMGAVFTGRIPRDARCARAAHSAAQDARS